MPTGRFAPSPSGPLHFGSLVAALASWLDARAARGRWLVRIEDLDQPRVQRGAADEILRTLDRLGLYWDGEVIFQSRRTALYEQALTRLEGTYLCACSRREIADSALALAADGAQVYPGTCRAGLPAGRNARALRIRVAGTVTLRDRVQGELTQDLEREVGDFVAKDLGPEGLKRSVVVVSTSDQSPPLMIRACFAATAIAEYFRDQGADVLLLMDSNTRMAMAGRQIGLAAGEPPAQPHPLPVARRVAWRERGWWAAALAIATAAAIMLAGSTGRPGTVAPELRLEIATPPSVVAPDPSIAISPDGRQIAFFNIGQARFPIYTLPAAGSARAPQPLPMEGSGGIPQAWLAAGELLFVGGFAENSDLLVTSVTGGEVHDVLATEYNEFDAALSPNGRWLAYVSNRTGANEVWVQGYPDGVAVRVWYRPDVIAGTTARWVNGLAARSLTTFERTFGAYPTGELDVVLTRLPRLLQVLAPSAPGAPTARAATPSARSFPCAAGPAAEPHATPMVPAGSA